MLADIVVKEIKKNFFLESRKRLSSIVSNSRKGIVRNFDDGSLEIAINKIDSMNLEEKTSQLVEEFLSKSGAELIELQDGNIKIALNDYFSGKPPFAKEGKKKSEFPDAIALRSLEEWAKENDAFIVAATKDEDWNQFCSDSEFIDAVETIEDALQALQEVTESELNQLKDFLTEMCADQNEVWENISADVIKEVSKELPNFDYSSPVHVEWFAFAFDTSGVSVVTVEGVPDFRILEAKVNSIKVQMSVELPVNYSVDFDLSVRESEDEDIVELETISIPGETVVFPHVVLNIERTGQNLLAVADYEIFDTSYWLHLGRLLPFVPR